LLKNFLERQWFRRHLAPCIERWLRSQTGHHAVLSIAIKRVRHGAMLSNNAVWLATDFLASIRHGNLLAHAMARAHTSDNCFSMVGPGSLPGPLLFEHKVGRRNQVLERPIGTQRAVFKRLRN